jgi:hypothetical protein
LRHAFVSHIKAAGTTQAVAKEPPVGDGRQHAGRSRHFWQLAGFDFGLLCRKDGLLAVPALFIVLNQAIAAPAGQTL